METPALNSHNKAEDITRQGCERKIDETAEGYNIIAEIVNILVDENYLGEGGKPQVEKMNLITYEPVHHGYVVLGERVGNAFSDGKKLK